MWKFHNCLVIIWNGTKSDMTYVEDWYERGRLADGFKWQKTIKPSKQIAVKSYEEDWAILKGCSGYVTYKMFDTDITIAFSNPGAGYNKLTVGNGGKLVWDSMYDHHDYEKFILRVDSSDGNAILKFDCKCSKGLTNICTVNVRAFIKQKL